MSREFIGTYILDGKTPVAERDTIKWGQWLGKANRHVAITMIGDLKVSTVFLGLDHNHWGKGKPILFESMVFDHSKIVDALEIKCHETLDTYTERYCTWEEAEAGHKKICRALEILREVEK